MSGATGGRAVPVLTLHPEAVPGSPTELRWVVPPDAVPFLGAVRRAPGPLGECLADGTLATVTFEDSAVVTALGCGATWAGAGERVRAALQRALADPAGWVRVAAPEDATAPPPVEQGEVVEAVRRVLDGPAGDYVRSHGGTAELVGIRDGVAEIRLTGACAHCPAATVTLKGRLEAEICAEVPQISGVREASGGLRRTVARLGRAAGVGGRTRGG